MKNKDFDYLKDDLTINNYMALMSCILNKDLTYCRALQIFHIEYKTNRWKKVNKQRKDNKTI